MEKAESNSHQLILSASQTDLLSMDQTGLPFCIRMVQMEILMIGILVPKLFDMMIQPAVRYDRHLIAQIYTGLVNGNRVKRGQHADIRDDRNIVLCVAITKG